MAKATCKRSLSQVSGRGNYQRCHCISQWVLPGLNTKMTAVPFRIWYANLVELKSLTCDVPSIILTATASVSTKRYIFQTLNLKLSWCLILEHSPERPQVQFGVQYLDKNMPVSSTFSSFIEELRSKKFSRMSWKRLSLFRRHLTTGAPESVNKHILDNIWQANVYIRIIACTVAFGMGVNCKGVHRIIHFDPSKNVKSLVQECGRAGRDVEQSSCLLLHNGLLGAHCMNDMKDFVSNSTDCRRTYIYSHFPGKPTFTVSGHQCCDICSKTCGCDQETCSTPAILPLDASSSLDDALPTESVRSVEEKDKHNLRSELFKYITTLLLLNVSGAVASLNIMHEFTPFHIQEVFNNCDKIKTLRNVEQFAEVWKKEHSRAILSAIQVLFGDVDANELKEPEHEDEMDEFA